MPIFRQCWGPSPRSAGVRDERPRDRRHLELQPALAVGSQAVPFGVLLGQPGLVEQFLCLLRGRASTTLRATPGRGVGGPSAGATEPGVPTPSQNASLSCSRSMPSERAWRKSLFWSHFAISGSAS